MIDAKKELIENADPKHKEFISKIVPSSAEALGVKIPVIRDIAKKICADDWRSFLNEPVTFSEERMLRALVIANAKVSFDERLKLIKGFVGEIDDWAICDTLCLELKVKGPDKERLWDYCLELIETDDEFKMRVSVVMMLDHFLDDGHIDDVLRILTSSYHPGYYYKMGAAWALSSCYIKYPEKTEEMLFLDSLDKEIKNKAVQKVFDSSRVSKEDKERLKAKKKAQ